MKKAWIPEEVISEELLDFISSWRKKPEILEFLLYKGIVIDERTFRAAVERFNETALQERGIFIAHSFKGYCATNDWDALIRTKKDYYSRGINMIKKARKLNQLMGLMDTIPLDLKKFIEEMEEKNTHESSH